MRKNEKERPHSEKCTWLVSLRSSFSRDFIPVFHVKFNLHNVLIKGLSFGLHSAFCGKLCPHNSSLHYCIYLLLLSFLKSVGP